MSTASTSGRRSPSGSRPVTKTNPDAYAGAAGSDNRRPRSTRQCSSPVSASNATNDLLDSSDIASTRSFTAIGPDPYPWNPDALQSIRGDEAGPGPGIWPVWPASPRPDASSLTPLGTGVDTCLAKTRELNGTDAASANRERREKSISTSLHHSRKTYQLKRSSL